MYVYIQKHILLQGMASIYAKVLYFDFWNVRETHLGC